MMSIAAEPMTMSLAGGKGRGLEAEEVEVIVDVAVVEGDVNGVSGIVTGSGRLSEELSPGTE